MKCPCCNGSGEVDDDVSPVHLSPLQFRIWDIVRKSPHGISIRDLVDRVYIDREDGGPEYATRCVWRTVWNANRRLAVVDQRIVSTKGWGSLYRLEHLK